MNETRAQAKGIFSEMKTRSSRDGHLNVQYDKVELALMFFVDFTLKQVSPTWQEIAFERNEFAGDQKFWDLVDETLADRGESATERLAVLYTCIGLGFTGWNAGQPEILRKKMLEISARLRGNFDMDAMSRVCPEAYDKTNTANLIEPPRSSLIGIGIALVALIAVLFVGNILLYRISSNDLREVLHRLTEGEKSQSAGAGAPSATRP